MVSSGEIAVAVTAALGFLLVGHLQDVRKVAGGQNEGDSLRVNNVL